MRSALRLLFSQPVNHAPDEFDTLQKVLDANVLIGTMWVRSGVAGPKRGYWCRRIVAAAYGTHWPTCRIHWIDQRRLPVDLGGRFDHRPRDSRLRRRLGQRRAT